MPDSLERPQNLLSYLLSELVLPDSFWDSSSLMLLFVRLLPFFPFFSPPPLFLAMQHAGYPTRDWTCAFCSGSMGSGSPGKSRLLPFHSPLYFPLVEKKKFKNYNSVIPENIDSILQMQMKSILKTQSTGMLKHASRWFQVCLYTIGLILN